MLGIIIGVASVITMLAIGQGSKRSIQAEISEMGSNMIMIRPGGDMQGGVRLDAETWSRSSCRIWRTSATRRAT